MLQTLQLVPADVLSGTPPGMLVGELIGRSPGTVLALTQDCGGRFRISDGKIFTGPNPTDCMLTPFHIIHVKETDWQNNTHLYTAIQIQVHPAYATGGLLRKPSKAPGWPTSISGQKIVSGTIQGTPAPAAPAAPTPKRTLEDAIAEAFARTSGAFVAEEVGKPPKLYTPERAHIAMYSEQDATQRGNVVEVPIAGEGTKKATHICLPEDREEYRSNWPDAVVLGVAIIKVSDNG